MSDPPEFLRIELDLRDSPPSKKVASNSYPPSPFECHEALEIKAMARDLAKDPEQAVAAYCADPETRGGAYVSGDELLRMLPGTAINPHLSYAICGGIVAALPRRIFKARLALPAMPGERVLLTMGMPATGKTTLVKGGFGNHFHTVLDSPLASFEFARELIQEIRASGRQASLVLAWRPLHLALPGMLDRALPSQEARAVTLIDMADILVNALRSFLLLAECNRYDEGTTLDFVEVLGGRRVWHPGPTAALQIVAIQEGLHAQGSSVLLQIISHWKRALALAKSRGIQVPDLLRSIAEDGLDVSSIPDSEIKVPSPPRPQFDGEFPGPVRSLCDDPRFANSIPGIILAANHHESQLRATSPFRWWGCPVHPD